MKNMKRPAVGLVAALFVLAAAPFAMADKPLELFFPGFPFVDPDPCTGELQEITIDAAVKVHFHRTNIVVIVKRTGFTDSGYELISGVDHFVANNNIETGFFKDTWKAPDGRMFEASGRFVFDVRKEELRSERGTFRCIGGEGL